MTRREAWFESQLLEALLAQAEAVMDLLKELHSAGATICMVTHDPRYARHADRSIHLFDGRIVDTPIEEAATTS